MTTGCKSLRLSRGALTAALCVALGRSGYQAVAINLKYRF